MGGAQFATLWLCCTHLDRLALGGAIVGDATRMLPHRGGRGHAVELLELVAVALHHLVRVGVRVRTRGMVRVGVRVRLGLG